MKTRYMIWLLLLILTPIRMMAETVGHSPVTDRKDCLAQVSDNDSHRKAAATFEDYASSMRLSLSRPQRVVPSSGTAGGKGTARLLATYPPNPYHLPYFCQRQKRFSLPPVVSRDYYVIALRRLLC